MSRLNIYRVTSPDGHATTILDSHTVRALKEHARKLKRQLKIPHHAALDRVAQEIDLPHWRAVCDAHEAMRHHEQALQTGWVVALDIKDSFDFAADEAGFVWTDLVPLLVREQLFKHFANSPDLDDKQQRPFKVTLGRDLEESFEEGLSELVFFLYRGSALPETIEAAERKLRKHCFWPAQHMWLHGQFHDPYH